MGYLVVSAPRLPYPAEGLAFGLALLHVGGMAKYPEGAEGTLLKPVPTRCCKAVLEPGERIRIRKVLGRKYLVTHLPRGNGHVVYKGKVRFAEDPRFQ